MSDPSALVKGLVITSGEDSPTSSLPSPNPASSTSTTSSTTSMSTASSSSSSSSTSTQQSVAPSPGVAGGQGKPPNKSSLRDKKGITLKKLDIGTTEKKPDTLQPVLEDASNLGKITVDGKTYPCTEVNVEIKELIARGAYGRVHRMRHKDLNMWMAVKQIRDSLDEERRKALVTDLDVIKRCDCRFIVTYYGYHFTEGDIWIYMELAMKSLDFVYADVKKAEEFIPEKIIKKIAYSVLQGLHYLKSTHSIMYRDLKPSNVLLTFDGSIKLCDFGISKILEKQSSFAKTALGCERYLPPERLNPETSREPYDVRSDVWAYGLTLVELALLDYPYPDTNVFQRLTAIVRGNPPTIPTAGGRYSQQLADFVALCLQKDKRMRPKFDHSPEANANEPCLLQHPYIESCSKEEVNIAEWYRSIGEILAQM